MTTVPASIFTNPGVWLRVWFNDGIAGFQQLTPDQRLAAVGYAIMAVTVPDGSITSAKIAPGAVGTAQLAPGAGGFFPMQTSAATNIQTVANYSYILTNTSSASLLTLPANPNIGDKIKISGTVNGFTIKANSGQNINGPDNAVFTESGNIPNSNGNQIFLACSTDGGQIFAAQSGNSVYFSSNSINQWTASSLYLSGINLFSGNWQSVASSSDGSKLVAAIAGGSIYTSTDSGMTWFIQTNAPTGNWMSVASSSDGSKLVAVQNSGGIYTSTNSGTVWTLQISAPTNASWQSIASSSDGSLLVAVQNGGSIYTSGNSGATWVLQTSAPSASWQSVASSSDGGRLVAVHSGGSIYISSNYGVTWTQKTNTSAGWQSVASSSDGSKLAAVQNGGWIYTSTNSGATWSQQTNAPSSGWRSISSSSDGSKLIAVNNWSYIYTSINYGVTWTQQNNAPSGNWVSVASSSDGNKLVALNWGGGIYTSENTGGAWWFWANVTLNGLFSFQGNWGSIVCSSNGQWIYVCGNSSFSEGSVSGGVLYSSNYGYSFNLLTNSPTIYYMAVSSDGSKLVGSDGGSIYTSTNYGVNWTFQTNGFGVSALASSTDGSKLIAGNNQVFYSTNAGVTWAQFTNIPSQNNSFGTLACSGDGNKIVGSSQWSYPLFTSPDFGNSWNVTYPNFMKGNQSCACSADGSRLFHATTFNNNGFSLLFDTSPDFGGTWTQMAVALYNNYYNNPNLVCSRDGTKIFTAADKIYALHAYQYNSIAGKAFSACELIYTGNGQWQLASSSGPVYGL